MYIIMGGGDSVINKIDRIKYSVQEVCEAVSAILSVDVTVVNTNLERIAATGKYKSQIGTRLPDGCYYSMILENDKLNTLDSLVEKEKCKNCKSVDMCEELATVGYPIVSNNGDLLGVMGLIAFNEAEKDYIYSNYEAVNTFLEKLSDLLAGNLNYENTIGDLYLKNKEMKNLINSLDYGIIITDENLRITSVNEEALKLLKTSFINIKEQKIYNIFENISVTDMDKKRILPLKSKLTNTDNEFMVKVIENKVDEDIKSYLFELSKYSKVLKNAYDILENKDTISFEQILGNSYVLKSTIHLAKQIAPGDSSVMVRGESGTGKELFARAIHNSSSRKNNMFIAINCASIPENLLESELFGYEKGAFTDASNTGKIGRFELANGGTLFLDEIGDLPLHLQPKLLRVLQDGSFMRLGGSKKIDVDFRLITATNKNLEEMIGDNTFREDLYYRLNVIPINIPPLRERREDIHLIAKNKLEHYCLKLNKGTKEFSKELQDIFCNHNWSGNIRELENIIEFLVNISEEKVISADLLPRSFNLNNRKDIEVEMSSNYIERDKNLKELTESFEKSVLIEYLKEYGYSTNGKQIIAEKLGMNLSTLYRKLYRYNII